MCLEKVTQKKQDLRKNCPRHHYQNIHILIKTVYKPSEILLMPKPEDEQRSVKQRKQINSFGYDLGNKEVNT